ncbi:hypothetical protein F2P81_009695 [Scophthalmus maximus]|uniref:Uncharacterized protein n=1 Tax=Scophthalmus maximus TaxID=52904 RepID=A0A6A4T0N0_SCOMX|nr:hypothetical protein F2P81_009695 [Scophthalmus maximus]
MVSALLLGVNEDKHTGLRLNGFNVRTHHHLRRLRSDVRHSSALTTIFSVLVAIARFWRHIAERARKCDKQSSIIHSCKQTGGGGGAALQSPSGCRLMSKQPIKPM